jgi:uncharacterized protein YcnI
VSLPRPLVRLGVVLTTALIALVAVTGVASAHVSVSAQGGAVPGGFGTLTFTVPNESDTATTNRVRIQIPAATPLASLRTQPVPGWTTTLTRAPLDPPVTDDDGNTITEAVSVVDFTAAAGGGIKPGEFQQFSVSGGPFPKADSLTLPVVQSYSDGSETAWIEPTVAGQAEPEHPAPVLSLAPVAVAPEDNQAISADPAAEHEHGTTTDQPAGAALFVGILALLTAIAGVVLAVRANRRTVGS